MPTDAFLHIYIFQWPHVIVNATDIFKFLSLENTNTFHHLLMPDGALIFC